uniref:Epidermal growth factor receptor pathway substrate 15 like 1 n=1 Tax=Podarcis muralis TaxID=64176 RepID=A0A670KJQ9_PODMU
FLKKSGLADVILGKIWDLADPEGKGFLDKQGFFVALRLVACAQNGHDVTLTNLTLALPPPKFVSAPLLISSSSDAHWAVRMEEKAKFDGIFESLLPVNGLLSGDKVKPVLMNSKLPLDILGRVWDLSDIDKDGHLDRDEFAVAMHLVYRALEKEPVPPALPPPLVPPSKRKKAPSLPGAVPVLPASPPPKDSLRSTPSHGSVTSLNSTGSLSPKHSLKQAQQPPASWVVPLTDKLRYDEIFLKTDLDLDGFVSGLEVKDIFMHSGLSQNILAHIWALADTRQMGKLNKDQFALAMHLIQQKVSKGIDPPQVLLPDMIPPSERTAPDSSSSVGSGGEFTGMKELDDIGQEIAQLQREKYSLEQEIREREGAIRQKTNEVQELQNDLDRETSSLQELEAQKQEAQGRLDEMEQQKAKLKDMLSDVRQKCQEETHVISSLKMQIQSQESDLRSQENDISRAKSELSRLQQEESQLEQSIQAGKVQLETIIKSLKSTQEEINQARSKLSRLQESQQEAHRGIDQYNEALNGVLGGSMTNLADLNEGNPQKERGGRFGTLDDPFKNKALLFSGHTQELPADPFQAEDPFRTDPFKGADPFRGDPFQNDPFAEQVSVSHPFGGDPFKESDPFRAAAAPDDFFRKPEESDPFTADPFSKNPTLPSKVRTFPVGGGSSFNSGGSGTEGFADFSRMSKPPASDPFSASSFGGFPDDPFKGKLDTPALPPKKGLPPRPKPPSGKSPPVIHVGSSDFDKPPDLFRPFGADTSDPFHSRKGFGDLFRGRDGFSPPSAGKAPKNPSSTGFADFTSLGNEEQQLAWAKRESEKAEEERLARLRRQEQEDLELAIALSKADMPAS